jgi:hypothetical protein
MSHPQLFDNDDALLGKVRSISLELPGAAEKVSHGRPTFFTKKVFVYYGASIRDDAGSWIAHSQCVLVQLDSEERHAAMRDARFFSPAYLGPYGWLGIDLDKRTDWVKLPS